MVMQTRLPDKIFFLIYGFFYMAAKYVLPYHECPEPLCAKKGSYMEKQQCHIFQECFCLNFGIPDIRNFLTSESWYQEFFNFRIPDVRNNSFKINKFLDFRKILISGKQNQLQELVGRVGACAVPVQCTTWRLLRPSQDEKLSNECPWQL